MNAPTSRPALGQTLTDLLMRYRWVYVVPLLLPASKIFALWQSARRRAQQRRDASTDHAERVSRVRDQVRRWNEIGRPGLLCTARRDWESIAMSQLDSYKSRNFQVNLPLYSILGIDAAAGTVTVEPGVTIGELTAYLLPKGWALPVVPELEDLTIGGLVLGYGIETSSHRHGLFADCVESYEVVLADASVVTASREEHADLFHALPWSRGSIGFLSAVELRLVPAARYVRLDYCPVGSVTELVGTIKELADHEQPPDFIEGFLFGPDEGVVVEGKLIADSSGGPGGRHLGHWYEPWFYEHVRARGHAPGTDLVTLRQYYHRHSRAIFWAAALLVPFGNQPLFRFALGWLMPPKISFLKLTETPGLRRAYSDQMVSQEGLVPIEHAEAAIALCQELYDAYPMWACPARLQRSVPAGMANPPGDRDSQLYLDIGVFFSVPGPVRRGEPWSARAAVKRFEAWLREHHGFPSTYAVSEMSEDEFRSTFDCQLYDAVRAAYGAEGTFLGAYEKLKRL